MWSPELFYEKVSLAVVTITSTHKIRSSRIITFLPSETSPFGVQLE